MKTFAITLERAKERKKYILGHLKSLNVDFEIIQGVDGRKFTEEDIAKYCDLEARKKSPHWITNGAIACALSHLSVYKTIIEQEMEYALVIEDDIVLPPNIKEIIEKCGDYIKPKEVILFYYTSFKECSLSDFNVQTIEGLNLSLYYPVNPGQPISGAAYLVHKTTAQAMIESVLPVRVAIDSWGYFLKTGVISSIRCLYPMTFGTKNFKSSIDYINPKSMKGRILDAIDKYKVPVLFQLISYMRKRNAAVSVSNFKLSGEKPRWLNQ